MPIVVMKRGNSCGAKGHYFSNVFEDRSIYRLSLALKCSLKYYIVGENCIEQPNKILKELYAYSQRVLFSDNWTK